VSYDSVLGARGHIWTHPLGKSFLKWVLERDECIYPASYSRGAGLFLGPKWNLRFFS
jgi:hypothetical protein